MNYKTLSKTEPDFKKYLLGSFSNTEVAIPVQSLNVDTESETITFEIVPKNQIQRPSVFKFVERLFKLKSFHMILVPLFFVFCKNYVDDRLFDVNNFIYASAAMLFLFAALNLRNDVNDHISGYDRIVESSKSPIQKGWITAQELSHLSWLLIFAAAFLARPVLMAQPESVRVVAVVLILVLVGQFFKKNSYKNQRFGEFILFLLMGPALLSGYQVSMGAGVDTEVLVFGVLWGFCILFLNYLNHFSHLLTTSQAKINNTMTRLGFDTAKNFLIAWLVAINILWLAFHFFYASVFWTWFTTITLVFWTIPTVIAIHSIASPVGSDLKVAFKKGYRNYFLLCTLLCLEMVWYIAVKQGWMV